MKIISWNEMLSPYEMAVNELKIKFEYIMEEYKRIGKYCPIESVEARVKSVSSIIEKAMRKGIPLEQIENRIEDIAGIRIICQFEDDIYRVAEYLKTRNDMKISSEIDYVATPKESGYRSYHIIVHYNVQTVFASKTIPVEIQIRTMAMNFWAVVEHSLQYKYNERIPGDIRRRLSDGAKAVLLLDREMSSIRDEIIDAQSKFRKKASIVHEIMDTIDKLSKEAPYEEVKQLHDRFNILYEQDDLEGLKGLLSELMAYSQEYAMRNHFSKRY